MMPTWQVWLLLSIMLYVGQLFRVGCFLGQFALASLLTAGVTLTSLIVDPESQLQLFLLLSLVFAGSSHYGRRRASSQG